MSFSEVGDLDGLALALDVTALFNVRRHLTSRATMKVLRNGAHQVWREAPSHDRRRGLYCASVSA